MLQRRYAAAIGAVVLLLAGCAAPSLPHLTPSLLVVTAGGSALVDGDDNVPPDLQLHVAASPSVDVSDVHLNLDGHRLSFRAEGDGVTARSDPLPLGSTHRLHIAAGATLEVGFRVVWPTPAMAALHRDPRAGAVLDLAFASAPSRGDVEAHLPPGGRRSWTDSTHLRQSWSEAPGGELQLPGELSTARGSHLAAPLRLDLSPLSPGALRSTVVPPAAARSSSPTVVAFTVATAASRRSLAEHARQISVVSPTGWLAETDGTLKGEPDPSAVLLAPGPDASRVWPLLQNDGFDPASTSRLLGSDDAVRRLVSTVTAACRQRGFGGVTLDFEGVRGDDRDALSALADRLGRTLHQEGRHLGVAVIPHKPAHLNSSSAAYDLPRLSRVADLTTLMAYDQHTEGTGPGPVAGLDWDTQILQGSLPGTTLAHTMLGMPLYSRAWDTDGHAVADSFAAGAATALLRPGAVVDMDFDAMTKVIRQGDGGVTWLDDSDSLARKMGLASAAHLGGIAVWRLGFEDAGFWDLLPAQAPAG
ncbi:MAG: glycosyl hydrolase family 18 protein [Candidatus Dormibacteraeota bacterium]|nr:glycosyl hydrolase family 18 protein [Candidatus Dormibacteraeota bacterium]